MGGFSVCFVVVFFVLFLIRVSAMDLEPTGLNPVCTEGG